MAPPGIPGTSCIPTPGGARDQPPPPRAAGSPAGLGAAKRSFPGEGSEILTPPRRGAGVTRSQAETPSRHAHTPRGAARRLRRRSAERGRPGQQHGERGKKRDQRRKIRAGSVSDSRAVPRGALALLKSFGECRVRKYFGKNSLCVSLTYRELWVMLKGASRGSAAAWKRGLGGAREGSAAALHGDALTS